MGIRQNTGDDGFLTRWVLFHHVLHPHAQDKNGTTARPRQWRLGIQLTPEAEVGTTIMRDSRFAGQMKRWYRSGLRHRLLCLLYEPGIREIWQTFPFMTRKMVEGMLNPILLWVRLWSIYKTSCVEPRFAYVLPLICSYRCWTDTVNAGCFSLVGRHTTMSMEFSGFSMNIPSPRGIGGLLFLWTGCTSSQIGIAGLRWAPKHGCPGPR
jgi:hypothetical protein